ncbi:haloacid dehalogenase, type II [Metarhizium album ARSEF 1941]|uniref:Haloacid dehalogenase, type II n=1 Tax=Metarhizium album (strain ARSEF 1941) TaxID=1081103 RepID=A0A0B2WUN8_METAS|nr:haloacid dehalogenase, type II [Metarhizium album ARSEF 1941]KHN96675.1 haloacid dehalogenase, type II [Metarhizium album ARSEF 1941]
MSSAATVPPLTSIKALAFDVFGTTVDWRSSVTEELTLRAYRKRSASPSPALKDRLDGLDEDDWGRFAQAWREAYIQFVKSFDPERDAWKSIDEHHRDSLVELLEAWGLQGLFTDAEIDSLSLVWHRLVPWPDAVDGLARLRDSGKLVLATLSNGNTGLVRDLNDFGGLGFHRLFCAETFRAYKPRPETYLGAAREMGLEPEQVAMVACHMGDLKAAKACGLKTIYVERPGEEAWDKEGDEFRAARNWVDLWIGEEHAGFVTMADRLLDVL